MAIRSARWHWPPMTRFKDHSVWITGGGTGLGRALALELARQGADVAVSGRRMDKLTDVVTAIEAEGKRGLAVPCDVTDEDDIDAAIEQVVAAFGKLDVVIANAGFSVNGRVERLTAADWRRQLDTNVVGAAVTAAKALPELRKTNGRIALVASVAGHVTYPGGAAYSASKFALRAIGLTLSMELHGSGVSCTTLHPGLVESDIARVDNLGVYRAERDDPRPARFMWPADKAARNMASAIYKRKREYVFTGHGKVGAWFGRHAPGLTYFAMERAGVEKVTRRTEKYSDG